MSYLLEKLTDIFIDPITVSIAKEKDNLYANKYIIHVQ